MTPLRLAAQTLKVFAMVGGAWFIGLVIGSALGGAGLGSLLSAVILIYIAAPIAVFSVLQWMFGGYKSLEVGIVLAVFSCVAGIFFVGLIDAMVQSQVFSVNHVFSADCAQFL